MFSKKICNEKNRSAVMAGQWLYMRNIPHQLAKTEGELPQCRFDDQVSSCKPVALHSPLEQSSGNSFRDRSRNSMSTQTNEIRRHKCDLAADIYTIEAP